MPAWLGWLSAVVTVAIVVLVLVGLAFPANVPALIWLLVVSIWALSQRTGEISATG